MNKTLILSLAALSLAATGHSLTLTGAVEQVSAPTGVRQGDYESNTKGRLFLEQAGLEINSPLALNAWTPGKYDAAGDLGSLPLSVPVRADSWFLHMDKVGTAGAKAYAGSITFDRPILGVIARRADLNASDALLGAAGTLYPSSGSLANAREFELGRHEWFRLSADMKTLEFSDRVSNRMDQIRILTEAEAVPEPASMAALAVGALSFLRRRRR